MTEEEKEIVKEYKRVIANSYGFAKYDDFVSNLIKYKTEGTIQNTIVDMVNLIEKLQKEITNDIERENSLKDDLMEIIETLKLENNVVCQETILQEIVRLQEENEELKEKVFKRDKKLIRLEEYANKNFERKDDVKANYIPKDKIREKREQEEKMLESGVCGVYGVIKYREGKIQAYNELLEEEEKNE